MNIFKRPMFFAAVICCVAAALSLYFINLTFAILLFSVLLLLIAVFFKKYKYLTVALTVVLFAVSLYFQFVKINDVNKFDNQKVSGSFLVVEEPEAHDDFNMVTLKPMNSNVLPQNTKYLVFDYKLSKIKIGDIVNADIKMSAIDQYDEYRLYNYSNGIYATATGIKISKSGMYNVFYRAIGSIRKYIKTTFSSYFSDSSSGLLLALTTGEKTLLSDEFLQNVKTTGISHVIVVSGMHLSIIMTAVFFCLDKLFYNKYIRSLVSAALVIIIFAICGFTMSITRAGTMFLIASFAPIFNRDNDSLNSLLTAVVFVLIGAPFAVFNISFQLSVLSTLAIIWVVPFYYYRIIEVFNISNKFLKTVIGTVLCSVFAITFTLPITIQQFGFVSIVSPLTNLLITYPLNLALVVSIISLLLNALPIINFISYLLFYVLEGVAKFITFVVNSIANLQITVAVLPKAAFWWSILLIFAVIGNMYLCQIKKEKK